MRKSFVALLLLGVAVLTNAAFAQDPMSDPGNKLLNAREAKERLTRATRLGTSATQPGDTMWVGHTPSAYNSATNPWAIKAIAPNTNGYRPGISTDGNWDWDSFGAGETDSLQGWWPARAIYTITGGLTLPDKSRPWWAIEHGNQANYAPLQNGRTTGVVGVWHVDGGSNTPGPDPASTPTWAPLGGTKSVWCGLRSHGDNQYSDPLTGNPYTGDVLIWNGINALGSGTNKKFPGYGSQWDQLLYRDVRVKDGTNLTVAFKFRTKMSTSKGTTASTRTGWFDKDPTSVTVGNFISSSDAGTAAPCDSFMVYVGVPANPTSARHADGTVGAIYDLRRRWFSEVIDISSASNYTEIVSVAGDSLNTTFSKVIPNTVIQPMLDATNVAEGGAGNDGILRIVFRSHTNRGFDDEDNLANGYSSGTEGAVRIDDVSVSSNIAGSGSISSAFESVGDINNNIEAPNSGTPGPAVGQGYAIGAWHATGKPPAHYFHTHPIFGGSIGGSTYAPLAYNELCGPPYSPARVCNIFNVIVSAGDHDNGEAAGGALNTTEQETQDGIFSPTINMVISGGTNNVLGTGTNGIGIDNTHVNVTDDYYIFYDMYAGIYNLFFTGNAWRFGMANYPAKDGNNHLSWGSLVVPPFQFFNPDPQCFTDFEPAFGWAFIVNSNASGFPDSLKLYLGKNQQCFRFSVSLGCSPTGGTYFDNVSLALSNGGTAQRASNSTALGNIQANIWDEWNDAFPRNETPGLPGTAAFDTTAALIQTGINNAQATNNVFRPDSPGDTAAVTASFGVQSGRVDLVFRIKPGPGNYVTPGVVGSGLRKVPSSTAAATSGDASFWGQYLASHDGGSGFGSPVGHVGGVWNQNVWNSARCDSVDGRLFPTLARGVGLPSPGSTWGATYHESDPKFNTLGIVTNRCFLIDTAGAINSTNITCGSGTYPPAWVTFFGAGSKIGWDGTTTTKEFTKIIPDGLLTPGSHVEYFFRKSLTADPANFVSAPDTMFITPQANEGPNLDGHRWQEFSVLPDAWKFTNYGGLGAACMLYVDNGDRRGDERTFIGVADSIGLINVASRGGHNGWFAGGSHVTDGGASYNGIAVGGDPTIAVWDHKGQAGTAFDMFGVKASESLTTSGGSFGGRLSAPGAGYLTGKDAKLGPTPEMLRTYYRQLLILTGDLNSGVFGPFSNRSADDVSLIEDFMTNSSGSTQPRGVWGGGDGFAESEILTGGVVASHATLIKTFFGADLRGSYQNISGSPGLGLNVVDWTPTSAVSPTGDVLGVQNVCTYSNDLLKVNTAVTGSQAAAFYQNIGTNGPYVSSVYVPAAAGRPYVTLLDGVDIRHMQSRFAENSFGRLVWYMDVLAHVFGSQCANWGSPTVDVPQLNTKQVINYMNLANNPLRSGQASVNFGITKTDRVQIDVYDVSGRHVRNLADRTFAPGQYKLTWDGTNDGGTLVPRGVYFTQVKYVNSRFVDSKKLTILK